MKPALLKGTRMSLEVTEPLKLKFSVIGLPKGAGSKRGFLNKRTGGIILVDATNNLDWRNAVTLAAAKAMNGRVPTTIPVIMRVIYKMPRPKGHYNAQGGIRDRFRNEWPDSAPDATKLTRCLDHAMERVVYANDAQVVVQTVAKIFTSASPGADVEIETIDPTINPFICVNELMA